MFRSMNFYRGILIGAGLMYLLDPEEGRTRRARLRDRLGRAVRGGGEFLGEATRDLRNRSQGAAARAASKIRPDDADDETLVERVRAKLGRYVSHPRAIVVEAHEGSVTLSGPILRGEPEDLIGAVSSVRGVREVMNRLEPHDPHEGHPALQGPGRRERGGASRSVRLTPGLQLVAGVLGATAVAVGARRIASRVRSARHEELERDMPEYAMLR